MKSINQDRISLVCLALFGLFVTFLVNINGSPYFSGSKFQAKVISLNRQNAGIDIIFEFVNEEHLMQEAKVKTYVEKPFIGIEIGENVSVYKCNENPAHYFIPEVNFWINLFLLFFFVFVPLIFAIFAKPAKG